MMFSSDDCGNRRHRFGSSCRSSCSKKEDERRKKFVEDLSLWKRVLSKGCIYGHGYRAGVAPYYTLDLKVICFVYCEQYIYTQFL